MESKPSKTNGQIAQLVEHGPEKAGVGGSSPPLTTLFQINSPSLSLAVCQAAIWVFSFRIAAFSLFYKHMGVVDDAQRTEI